MPRKLVCWLALVVFSGCQPAPAPETPDLIFDYHPHDVYKFYCECLPIRMRFRNVMTGEFLESPEAVRLPSGAWTTCHETCQEPSITWTPS